MKIKRMLIVGCLLLLSKTTLCLSQDRDLESALALSLQEYEYGTNESLVLEKAQVESLKASKHYQQKERSILETQNCEYQISLLQDQLNNLNEEMEGVAVKITLLEKDERAISEMAQAKEGEIHNFKEYLETKKNQASVNAKKFGGQVEDYLKRFEKEFITTDEKILQNEGQIKELSLKKSRVGDEKDILVAHMKALMGKFGELDSSLTKKMLELENLNEIFSILLDE